MPGAHLEKEVEELRESNHRLKLTIESSKQIHQNELEFLKDELQIKEKELQSLLEKLKTQKKKQDIDIEEKVILNSVMSWKYYSTSHSFIIDRQDVTHFASVNKKFFSIAVLEIICVTTIIWY